MSIHNNAARRRTDAVVERVENTPGDISGLNPYDRAAPSERPASFRNDSGETIPAYACMELASGAKYSSGAPTPFFIASKPGATLLTDRFALNGPNRVANGDHGQCYLSGQAKALYNSGTPAAGDAYGPTPGQWYLTKDYPPIFRVAVISDATPKHVYGQLHPIALLRGELKDVMPTSGSVAAGQTATATFLSEDDTRITDIEFEVTDVFGVYRGRAWASGELRGSKLYAKFCPDSGEWEIVKMEPHALRISGTVDGTVESDEDVTLSSPVIMSPSGALAMEDLTTADLGKNVFAFEFANGSIAHLAWNEAAVQWEVEDPGGASGDTAPHRITGFANTPVHQDTPPDAITLSDSPAPEIMNPVGATSGDTYTEAGLIENPHNLQFAAGDRVDAEWNDTADEWQAVGIGRPRPHRISGTSAGTVASDEDITLASPVIMGPIGAITDEVLTATDLVINVFEFTFQNGDIVHAEWNDDEEQWEAVDPGDVKTQATWLLFTADTDFLTGGAISIDARTYHSGEAPAVAITSIANPLNLTGYDNATGIAIIDTDDSPPTYTAISVSRVAEDVLTDFNVDTTNFELEKKVRSISIMPRGDESADWVEVHQGGDCP